MSMKYVSIPYKLYYKIDDIINTHIFWKSGDSGQSWLFAMHSG